eukprot:2601073-Rhodomonas_salina.1
MGLAERERIQVRGLIQSQKKPRPRCKQDGACGVQSIDSAVIWEGGSRGYLSQYCVEVISNTYCRESGPAHACSILCQYRASHSTICEVSTGLPLPAVDSTAMRFRNTRHRDVITRQLVV